VRSRRLRNDRSTVPEIIITAFDDARSRAQAERLGTPPVSGSRRSSTRRSSMPSAESNGGTRRSSFTIEPLILHRAVRRSSARGTRRCSAPSRLNKRRWIRDTRRQWRRSPSTARKRAGHREDDRNDAKDALRAALNGEPKSSRPCSRGARPMGSARAIRPSRGDSPRPVAADTSGVRTDECPGIGVHRDVRPGE
jgi:hypothetical protein